MSSSGGNYVTSYDTANKTFKHDVTRGKWSSKWDFSLACITHAFGLVNFSILPIFIMTYSGALFIIPYILCTILFVFPIFCIQTFLGQFSSTGFISVFRISPLFKGIAYVIVVLNIVAACINAVGASYSLVYFFASFSPTLPWMSYNYAWNHPNRTTAFIDITNDDDLYHTWSTVEYFFTGVLNFPEGDLNALVWPVLGASIVTWLVVGFVFYKGIESVTHFLRYSTVAIVAILLLIFLRVACLPDSINGLQEFLFKGFKVKNLLGTWVQSPLIAVSHFGTGWGIVLTMASHNNFKTNVYKNALVVTLSLMCLGTIAALTVFLTVEYLKEHLNFDVVNRLQSHPFLFIFLAFPHLFGNIEASNMWSLLFFLMLALCELNAVVIILFSTMTTLFDEYEYLRIYKKQISMILPAALFALCIAFTTNLGFELFTVTVRLCGASQMGICFLELMIAVWIYGRQRFQRDVQFMMGHTIATWQFYLVRFVTPIFILFLLFIFISWSADLLEGYDTHFSATIVIATLKFLPWLFIPAFVVIKLARNSGKITERFKRCVRPNDWYPSDAADRQRYEETLGNADISHQLVQSNFN